MLNRSHATASTLYNKLSQKLIQTSKTLPMELIGRLDWIIARYIRWCALHAAGGGWMSDYDVFNKSFKPEDAELCIKNDTLFVNNDGPAYLFYATKEHAENVLKIFIQEPLVDGISMIDECKILHYEKNCKKQLKKIQHIRCAKNLTRSKLMEELVK
jgi:hypothetical protein